MHFYYFFPRKSRGKTTLYLVRSFLPPLTERDTLSTEKWTLKRKQLQSGHTDARAHTHTHTPVTCWPFAAGFFFSKPPTWTICYFFFFLTAGHIWPSRLYPSITRSPYLQCQTHHLLKLTFCCYWMIEERQSNIKKSKKDCVAFPTKGKVYLARFLRKRWKELQNAKNVMWILMATRKKNKNLNTTTQHFTGL